MSSESEKGIPEEAKNFNAPDESDLVKDIAKAQEMAHAGNEFRTYARRLRETAKNNPTEESWKNPFSNESFRQDHFADKAEADASLDYDLANVAHITKERLKEIIDNQRQEYDYFFKKEPSPENNKIREASLARLERLYEERFGKDKK